MPDRTVLRTLATAVLGAVLIGPALSAVPAGAASQACTDDAVVCFDSVTITPSSVANTAAATVTISVHVAKGSPGCVYVYMNDLRTTPVVGATQMSKKSGGNYSYSFSVNAFNPPGQYPFLSLNTCNHGYVQAPTLTAAGLPFAVTVTGTPDTTAPVAQSFGLGATSVDVTTQNAAVPVTVTATDDVTGVAGVSVAGFPAGRPTNLDGGLGYNTTGGTLTRTGGTGVNGTWTGTVVIPGGTNTTWGMTVTVKDQMGNARTYTTADLTARGFTAQVQSRTTAAPPTPTGVRAVTGNALLFGAYVAITGPAQVSGRAMATDWVVDVPAGCGEQGWALPGRALVYDGAPGLKLCTYTVRAVNAFGSSAGAKVSALI
ncbi:hypothetical protein ACIB24_16840 [Spongisporangium articulatum]|uniref:Uncharacterized protein n=1 Tax=Spongisporangium articulatum TaxID=3362603 RepID=A0ABW8ARL9_9ACTN